MNIFKADEAWVVEIDDFKWFPIEEEARTEIIARARTEAREVGCTSFAIFVIPDPLFPLYGVTQKKRVHNEQLASGAAFTLTCTHHADLVPEVWLQLDEKGQARVLKTVRDILAIKGRTNPGRYEIRLPTGVGGLYKDIERGRV